MHVQDLESEIRRPLKRVYETAGKYAFQNPASYCVNTCSIDSMGFSIADMVGLWIDRCAHCSARGFSRTAK